MLNVEEIRTRIRKPTPTPSPPNPGRETEAQERAREYENKWLSEWASDRRDLHRALDEIELLRKQTSPELVALLGRWNEARRTQANIETEMARLADKT